MKNKEPYVVYQKCEMDFKLSPAELMVYLSIKSYCANGKREFGLSSRMIMERTSLSQPYVIEITRKLIVRGIVRNTGSEGHLGGNIPVYQVIFPVISKVITPDISNSKISDNHSEESDRSTEESDNYSGSQTIQSKKVTKENVVDINSESIELSKSKQKILQVKGEKARQSNLGLEVFVGNNWKTINHPIAYAKTLPESDVVNNPTLSTETINAVIKANSKESLSNEEIDELRQNLRKDLF